MVNVVTITIIILLAILVILLQKFYNNISMFFHLYYKKPILCNLFVIFLVYYNDFYNLCG